MSRGMTGINSAAAAADARMAQYKPRNYIFFKLPDNTTAQVRFLEQGDDVAWAYCHEVYTRANQQFPDWLPSIDQSEFPDGSIQCPLILSGAKRSFRGWINVIWRDAPVLKKGPDGKVIKPHQQIGTKDQLALWSSGITLFRELAGVDAQFKGLCSRDFNVKKLGVAPKISFQVMPVTDEEGNTRAVPMSQADQEIAKVKPDLNEFTTPLDYDALTKVVNGGGMPRTQPDAGAAAAQVNPFMRR